MIWGVVETSTVSGTVLLWGSILTFLGVAVSSVFGYLGHRQAKANNREVKEINNAVNHKAPEQLRLFDMVAETHAQMHALAAFQARWEDMPPGLSSAQEVVTHLGLLGDRIHETSNQLNSRLDNMDRQNAVAHRGFEDHISKLESKVDSNSASLAEHVNWEKNVKWPSLEVPAIQPGIPDTTPEEAP
jgi:hypothetical protein